MFIHIRDLELKPVGFDVELAPGSISFLDPKLKQSAPLHAVGQAELVIEALGEIRVKGQVQVRLQMECDRCLEPTVFPVDSSFELYYRPVAEGYGEGKSLDAGEAEMGFYEGDGLELNDVLREFVLLALPMRKLCDENCKGICPVCGQNRNQSECSCPTAAGDDRWAALKEIRKNAES